MQADLHVSICSEWFSDALCDDRDNFQFSTQYFSAPGGTAMALRPLRDKVVVKPSEEESKSSGGIFLPDTAKKKPQEGSVIAVGTGRLLDDGTIKPLTVKVGDTVVYSKYGGTEVTFESTDYVLLDEDQIFAVIEN